MGMNPIAQPPPEQHKSLWGKIAGLAGTVLGGTIGSIVPGVGTAAGAALGGGLGSTVGGLASGGGQSGTPRGPSLIDTAVKNDPALQMGIIQEGKTALASLPMPIDEYKKHVNALNMAQDALSQKLGVG